MSCRVLLLDSTYEPLKVISWTKAMHLVVCGDVEVIEVDSTRVVRSATMQWDMPSVIRQRSKFKRVGDVQFNRGNVYLRDSWTCQYCGSRKPGRELTFDHVIPRDQGGLTTWVNIVAACRRCNHDKANYTPEQAGMSLLRQPVKPKWLPTQINMRGCVVPVKWKDYLDEKHLADGVKR